MRTFFALTLTAAVAASGVATPADARPRREQDAAFHGTMEGRFIPLPLIERRIVPQMQGARYLGPEFDPGAGRYRLKFMRGPQVMWVDVDARTGHVVGKSGF